MSRPGAVIGGKNAWKVFDKRGIIVSLQWVMVPAEFPGEPDEIDTCMVLMKNPPGQDKGSWCIPLNSMYLYDEPKGREEAAEVLKRCCDAAVHIGLAPTKNDTMRVLAAIHDHLEDLKNMPPATKDVIPTYNAGEAKLFIQKKLAAEMLVKSDGTMVH